MKDIAIGVSAAILSSVGEWQFALMVLGLYFLA